MTQEFEYLTPDDLFHLAALLLGDPLPVPDIGLLGAAAARPHTTVFGEDAFEDGPVPVGFVIVRTDRVPTRRQSHPVREFHLDGIAFVRSDRACGR